MGNCCDSYEEFCVSATDDEESDGGGISDVSAQ